MVKRLGSAAVLSAAALWLCLGAPAAVRAGVIALVSLAVAVEAARLVSGAWGDGGGNGGEGVGGRVGSGALAAVVALLLLSPLPPAPAAFLLLALLGVAALRQPRTPAGLGRLAAAAVAGVWVGFAGAALLALGAGEAGRAVGNGDGGRTLLFLLLVVMIGEAAAFAGGKTIGGPRLAPVLSPGKTWAGFVSQLLVGAAVGAIAAPPLLAGAVPGSGVPSGVFLGLLLSLAAALGDLFASYWKRASGKKDSGRLIPGHGGLLDRLDGLLFAAPALAAAL